MRRATDPAAAGFFMPGKLSFSCRKPPGKAQDSCRFPLSFLQLSSQKHTSFLVENLQVSSDFPARNIQVSSVFLAGFLGLSWVFLGAFLLDSGAFLRCSAAASVDFSSASAGKAGGVPSGRAVRLRPEPPRVSALRVSIPHPTARRRAALRPSQRPAWAGRGIRRCAALTGLCPA